MLNKAILIGRMVTDPELKTTPIGAHVCSFRIAVDRAYRAKGEERKADFLSIVTWRQNAEFVSHFFKKGRLIGVEGSIQTRDYQNRDGNKVYVTEIVADRCFFVDSKKDTDKDTNDFYKPSYSKENKEIGSAPASYADIANAEFIGKMPYQSGTSADFQIMDDDDLLF